MRSHAGKCISGNPGALHRPGFESDTPAFFRFQNGHFLVGKYLLQISAFVNMEHMAAWQPGAARISSPALS